MYPAFHDDFGGVLRIARTVAEPAAMGQFLLLECGQGQDISPGGASFREGGLPAGEGFDPGFAGRLVLTIQKCGFRKSGRVCPWPSR